MSLHAHMNSAAVAHTDDSYDPRTDQGEYMNPRMRTFFYNLLTTRLIETRDDISKCNTAFHAKEKVADPADRASQISEERIAQSRIANLKKVQRKIDEALKTLKNDPESYGYDERGEEIGVDRLMVVPWATKSADNKERDNRHRSLFSQRSFG